MHFPASITFISVMNKVDGRCGNLLLQFHPAHIIDNEEENTSIIKSLDESSLSHLLGYSSVFVFLSYKNNQLLPGKYNQIC